MTRLFSRTGADSPAESSAKPVRMRVPQVGLSTLLLATACIAAWGSSWLNQRRIAQLDKQVASMRSLARELVIKDRDHLAIIQRHPELFDQQIWHVFVPDDSFLLQLLTRNIPPGSLQRPEEFGTPTAAAPLPAGRHVIELKSELEQDQWVTQVLLDNQSVMAVREPKEWNAGRGSSGGGQFSRQSTLPPEQPAVLFSRIFMLPEGEMGSKLPAEPDNGIALWIRTTRIADAP